MLIIRGVTDLNVHIIELVETTVLAYSSVKSSKFTVTKSDQTPHFRLMTSYTGC